MKREAWWAAALVLGVSMAGGANAAKNEKHEKPQAKAAPAASKVVMTDVAPPSGSWEGTPPAAQGYVWSKGYYEWKDGRYAWKQGEWVLLRPGFEYRQHQWVQKGDKWMLTGGDWAPTSEKESVAGTKP